MNDLLIKTFKALGDQNRLKIMAILFYKPLYVCEICKLLNLAISTTSKHLSILYSAGLICENKEGKWVKCTIDTQSKNPYVGSVLQFLEQWIGFDNEFQRIIDSVSLKHTDFRC